MLRIFVAWCFRSVHRFRVHALLYPRLWDTNSFDPVTTEGFMPEMGVLP